MLLSVIIYEIFALYFLMCIIIKMVCHMRISRFSLCCTFLIMFQQSYIVLFLIIYVFYITGIITSGSFSLFDKLLFWYIPQTFKMPQSRSGYVGFNKPFLLPEFTNSHEKLTFAVKFVSSEGFTVIFIVKLGPQVLDHRGLSINTFH